MLHPAASPAGDSDLDVNPNPAGDSDLAMFHAEDYVAFLRGITPETVQDQARAMEQFNIGGHCPVFKGLYQYCQAYAGASIGCAVCLNVRKTVTLPLIGLEVIVIQENVRHLDLAM